MKVKKAIVCDCCGWLQLLLAWLLQPACRTPPQSWAEGVLKTPTADGSPLRCVRRYLRRRGCCWSTLLHAGCHRVRLLRSTSPEAAAVGISPIPPSNPLLPATAPAQRSDAAGISIQWQVRFQEGACSPGFIAGTCRIRITPASADEYGV